MAPSKLRAEFWRRFTLSELTEAEWEALCDGCGRCCLVCLEDEETNSVWESDIVCKYFDKKSRKCTCYQDRTTLVPSCVDLTARNLPTLSWMPETCAYRLLDEGKSLPSWHPLISKNVKSVVEAGIALGDNVLHETFVRAEDIEDRLVRLRKTRPVKT